MNTRTARSGTPADKSRRLDGLCKPVGHLTEAELARFLAKTRIDDDSGCWIWTASLMPGGYAQFFLRGRPRLGHRIAWLHYYGPTPHGTELDHLCRLRHCVNPDHLEPVSHTENVRRSRVLVENRGLAPHVELPRGVANKNKTHCHRGHEYTPENTIQRPEGWRRCRTCTEVRCG